MIAIILSLFLGIIAAIEWNVDHHWAHLLYKIPICSAGLYLFLKSAIQPLLGWLYGNTLDISNVAYFLAPIIIILTLPTIFIIVTFYPSMSPSLNNIVNGSGIFVIVVDLIFLLALIPILLFRNILKLFKNS